ncbi:twin-arginine translocation signal domain-containing protein [Halosimplex amylolyticum]|uniref:twin-arginine translocation signal domain-containing protein n=1 Tax=Halosimplex amylolyticum TaxID=3396616 RepID=UPI003F5663D5
MADENTAETATDEPSRRTFLKSGALATGALAVGSGAVVSGTAQEGDDEDGDSQSETDPFASVQFTNQETGGTDVVVDEATFSEPGYVAFHDLTLFEGDVLESVVGVTERLDTGVHYQTEAQLFDVPGADFEQTSLEGTGALVAMPHRESGDDDTYDFVESGGEEDGPIAEAGLPVVDLAFVAATGDDGGTDTATPDGTATETPTETEAPDGNVGETATDTGTEGESMPFATVDFENQMLDGDTVSVGEAVLSEGGYVALHDARLVEGQTLESVVGVSDYLEPGRHREIEVTLDDPDAVAEVTFPPAPVKPLIPMPHMETDGDETYDFVTSEGAEDGPYTEIGQAVVDLGFVVPEDDGTATETAGAETEAPTGTDEMTDTDTATETETATDTDGT